MNLWKSAVTKAAVAAVAGSSVGVPLWGSAEEFSTVYVMTDNLDDRGFSHSAAADNGKNAIGVGSNQNHPHPDHIIASMLNEIGNSVYDSIKQARPERCRSGPFSCMA